MINQWQRCLLNSPGYTGSVKCQGYKKTGSAGVFWRAAKNWPRLSSSVISLILYLHIPCSVRTWDETRPPSTPLNGIASLAWHILHHVDSFRQKVKVHILIFTAFWHHFFCFTGIFFLTIFLSKNHWHFRFTKNQKHSYFFLAFFVKKKKVAIWLDWLSVDTEIKWNSSRLPEKVPDEADIYFSSTRVVLLKVYIKKVLGITIESNDIFKSLICVSDLMILYAFLLFQ